MNYTEEDISNLAEFLYLAHQQTYWEELGVPIASYKGLGSIEVSSWKAAAKVALEFKVSNNIECKYF